MNLSEPNEKSILIVDDDEGIRDLIEFIAKKEGFKTDKAADGKTAIKKVKTQNPDLIILDLMLPVYGGFEILRELQMYETTKIPVIVITGKYMDRTTQEMIKMEPNVVDFVEKPIKTQVLALLMHKILKTSPKPGK